MFRSPSSPRQPAFAFGGKTIYVDPWSKLADYTKMPKKKPTVHPRHRTDHRDHLDPRPSRRSAPPTPSHRQRQVRPVRPRRPHMKNGDTQTLAASDRTVPAYNSSTNAPRPTLSPQGEATATSSLRDKRFYIAGDTENTRR